MTTITAAMVKELRERTGAGMMECKKALEAAHGDIEAAIDAMRASGQAKAAKRAGKIAAEGLVIIRTDKNQQNACLVEVNCETDFVARSDQFAEFVQTVADHCLKAKAQTLEELLQLPLSSGQESIEKARQELVTKIGENVQIRRMASLSSEQGIIGSYLHGNRIGVLVSINKKELELAKDLAMHIAATNPQAIDADQVPAEIIHREREIFIAQSKESGKPDNIIEKMVSGRIAKFLKEICLVDQPFIKDQEQTIGTLLKARQAQVLAFVRFEVGEGIEKEVKDFAAEVKSQLEG